MSSPAIGMDLKFHSRILPIALIVMGVFCLVNRNSITCYNPAGINSSSLESYCPEVMKLPRPVPKTSNVPHPGVIKSQDMQEEEKRKVPLNTYCGLMLIVWAWVFYSTAELWKYMEGGFMKSLQDGKAPQEIILKNPGKCRLYLIKYLLVLALAILQLLLFMILISLALNRNTWNREVQRFEKDLKEKDLENTKSGWIDIANGEHVLPMIAKCTYHHFGPSGEIQKYDIMCHLNFNSNLEMIYLCCMVFSIISMVHLVMAFVHNIIVSCVNLLQVLHLCLYGSYTWTEARESLAKGEMFSGKWMLLQMFLPIEMSDNSNKEK